MSRDAFHWRDINSSKPLQRLRDEILKEASGPLSGRDIQLQAQTLGFWVVNPGTDIGEIGRNPGHTTSGGVRFPDGVYRYWLIAAPGWTARWHVTPDFKIVPGPGAAYRPRTDHVSIPQSEIRNPQSNEPPAKTAPAPSHNAAQPVNNIPHSDVEPTGLCIKGCGTQLPPEHRGAPICAQCRGAISFLRKEEASCL